MPLLTLPHLENGGFMPALVSDLQNKNYKTQILNWRSVTVPTQSLGFKKLGNTEVSL